MNCTSNKGQIFITEFADDLSSNLFLMKSIIFYIICIENLFNVCYFHLSRKIYCSIFLFFTKFIKNKFDKKTVWSQEYKKYFINQFHTTNHKIHFCRPFSLLFSQFIFINIVRIVFEKFG